MTLSDTFSPNTDGFQAHPKLLDFLRLTPMAFNNIAQGRGASPRTLGDWMSFDPERVTQRHSLCCETLSG